MLQKIQTIPLGSFTGQFSGRIGLTADKEAYKSKLERWVYKTLEELGQYTKLVSYKEDPLRYGNRK